MYLPTLPSTVAAVVLAWVSAHAARADDQHYLLLFASQGEPTIPRWSHTFATFVKATGAGADRKKWQLSVETISWLPASGVIVPKLKRDRGRNFDLSETLAWARGHNARVMLWGPYETNGELYALAKKRIAQLESGSWSYRLLDAGQRHIAVANCVHAVCDLVPGEPLITGSSFGEAASAKVARHLRPWLVEPGKTHDWLIERLGLKDQSLLRRGM